MKVKVLALPLSSVLVLSGLTSCQSTSKDAAQTPAPVPSIQPSTVAAPATAAAASATPGAGYVTTASGLRYQVLTSGPADGRKPTISDSVTVHYHGTLTDGTVFDSSYERGEPITFGVSQVIPGWTEALQLMKPGDTWMLYIPARLAYGSRSMGDKIPANSDLIFKVALLQVQGL